MLLIVHMRTSSGLHNQNPIDSMRDALRIYLIFWALVHLSAPSFLLAVVLLATIRLVDGFVANTTTDDDTNYIQIRDVLTNIATVVLIVGVAHYTISQYRQHKHHWSTYKYVFGVSTCTPKRVRS